MEKKNRNRNRIEPVFIWLARDLHVIQVEAEVVPVGHRLVAVEHDGQDEGASGRGDHRVAEEPDVGGAAESGAAEAVHGVRRQEAGRVREGVCDDRGNQALEEKNMVGEL